MDSVKQITQYNRSAWNQQVKQGSRWTIPVGPSEISRAREGFPQIILTPIKTVPQSWLENLPGKKTLMLASGGGQQTPLIAAAGADVTSFDLSPAQLARDQEVADREQLVIQTVEGNMADLSVFGDNMFDLIIHPCSNSFVPDVRAVWKEAARVLKPGGELLAGFCNPLIYIFDYEQIKLGQLVIRHSIPYSDFTDLNPAEKQAMELAQEPFCFGHPLEDQLAGQTTCGLEIIDLYEDKWGPGEFEILDRYIASFLATRSRKR